MALRVRDRKEYMREYQRRWMAKRRSDFFSGKKCKNCGSTENIQLHHRNPDEKESHTIWSWSEERRLAEIKKCDILCRSCHYKEHIRMGSYSRGSQASMSKLTEKDIPIIRKRIERGDRQIDIAKDFGVSRYAISGIKLRKTWVHVK